jgi:uncharacterized membrane protein
MGAEGAICQGVKVRSNVGSRNAKNTFCSDTHQPYTALAVCSHYGAVCNAVIRGMLLLRAHSARFRCVSFFANKHFRWAMRCWLKVCTLLKHTPTLMHLPYSRRAQLNSTMKAASEKNRNTSSCIAAMLCTSLHCDSTI